MQNVRPAGFARPQAGQVGPDGASDGAVTGGAGIAAADGDAGWAPMADAGIGKTGAAVGAAASGPAAGTGDDAPGAASAGRFAGAPASSAANSRYAPQLPQNASPAAFCVPHFAQIIPLAFASLGRSLDAG